MESEAQFITQISDSFKELADGAMKNLSKCLSKTKLKELIEFASFVETYRQSDKKICIGSELTKEERTCLHRNVRLAFPYLQTETIRSEQEKEKTSLIFARSDEVYWEFSDLLSDRDQVDRLLCFAHWQSRRTPATLDIDVSSADKQQRTKIHRLLSKHLGSFLESKTFNYPDSKLNAAKVGQSYIQIRIRAKVTKPTCQQKSKPNNPRY